MEFSKRIAVIAGVASWGCVVLGVVAALLTREFVPEAPVDLMGVAAWTAFGAVLATFTTVLAARATRARATINQTFTLGRVSRQEAEAKAGQVDLILLRIEQNLITCAGEFHLIAIDRGFNMNSH